jgi:uncharacterized protein
LATLAWGAVVTFAASPIDSALLKTVFGWVPAGFTATTAADAASYATYSRTILLITFGSLILINGVAAPIVEELYFRGYLMPRISRFGWKTPLLEDVLFALYHIWQPWAYVTILLTMPAYIFPVFRKRNIYIGIWAHTSLNIVGNRSGRTDPAIRTTAMTTAATSGLSARRTRGRSALPTRARSGTGSAS